MTKKRIALLAVIAVLATAGTIMLRRGNGEAGDRILISGNIELDQVDIAFKTAGRLVERLVDEGERVEKGAVLARLDQDQLLRQREREEASLALAEALLAQAETAVQWQRETLDADLDQRRAELSSWESRLLELKNGARPEEIAEAKAGVEAAESEYDRAAREWERARKLYEADDISTSQFDGFRNRYQNAGAGLKQARERLALVVKGPRSEAIEAAGAQVARARAGLKFGQANELELRRKQQEIAARRAEIARARAQIAVIDSQLADTVAASPVAGVVLTKAANAGEVLAPGTAVVTVGDIDRPWLRGYITERDLGRVKLGARANVTTDSFPGKVYTGRVTFIASEAEFTPKQIQTAEERVKLVYRIKIDVENPQQELKSNMPADAEILLAEPQP